MIVGGGLRMTGPPARFAIDESPIEGGGLRLTLTGDLDLASAPLLGDRLANLRGLRKPVWLDLSRLDFIDSTGLHVLVREFCEARIRHWELRIEPDVAPQVMRLFELVHVEQFVFDAAPGSRPGSPRMAASHLP
jgi:anti-sigma B factor antagonist